MTERSPDALIWDILRGALTTKALALVVDLGIPARLADGPRHVDDLARETGADSDTLHRLLRALASDGVFAEGERGVFRQTAASELLRHEGWGDFREHSARRGFCTGDKRRWASGRRLAA